MQQKPFIHQGKHFFHVCSQRKNQCVINNYDHKSFIILTSSCKPKKYKFQQVLPPSINCKSKEPKQLVHHLFTCSIIVFTAAPTQFQKHAVLAAHLSAYRFWSKIVMKFVKNVDWVQCQCLHTILLAVHTPLLTSSLK